MPSIYNSKAQTPTDLKIATQTGTFDCLNKLPICIRMPFPYLFYTVNHNNPAVHHVHHITTSLFLLSIRITALFILYNTQQPHCLTSHYNHHVHSVHQTTNPVNHGTHTTTTPFILCITTSILFLLFLATSLCASVFIDKFRSFIHGQPREDILATRLG